MPVRSCCREASACSLSDSHRTWFRGPAGLRAEPLHLSALACLLAYRLSGFPTGARARALCSESPTLLLSAAFSPESCCARRIWLFSPGSERGIDDCELMSLCYEVHFRDSKHSAKLLSWYFHGAGRRRGAWRRLREGGRHRGVKCRVALHLLH